MTFIQKYKNELQLLLLAVACFALVLGVFWFIVARSQTYRPAESWKTYDAGAIVFKYPEEWEVQFCNKNNNKLYDIKLSGKLAVDFKNQKDYMADVVGRESSPAAVCNKGKLTFTEVNTPACGLDLAQKSESRKLSNGLYIVFSSRVSEDRYGSVGIAKGPCEATSLFIFELKDPEANPKVQYWHPLIERGLFMDSPQYKDIVKFAESIRIKNN